MIPTRSRPTTTPFSTSSTATTPSPVVRGGGSAGLPATVKETMPRKSTILLKGQAPTTVTDDSGDHPQDNEIAGSGVDNVQAGFGAGVPEPSGPFRVDSADQSSNTHQAKLNLGAVIALGVFGGFVFLAAVITTVVILIRR